MRKYLGTLKVKIFRHEDGRIEVDHDTELGPALNHMESAMTGTEKTEAAMLRRDACRATARFFLFVRDPDRPEDVEPE
tara:strand:+ start:460 stop:693 length:234 start_codon:yes stop_codon:yes gene_type:complete